MSESSDKTFVKVVGFTSEININQIVTLERNRMTLSINAVKQYKSN